MLVRTLVLCAAFSAINTASDILRSEDVDKLVKECAKETNTAESEYSNGEIIFSTPAENLLCMGKCLAEKLEIVDSDGVILKDKVSEIVDDWPEDFQSATLECVDKVKKISSCNDIEEYRKCIEPTAAKAKKMYH